MTLFILMFITAMLSCVRLVTYRDDIKLDFVLTIICLVLSMIIFTVEIVLNTSTLLICLWAFNVGLFIAAFIGHLNNK